MITKNTKPLLVGLTGGIASGKSTVIKYLIEEGYAENEESANQIILGMSERWYNLIID